MFDSLKLTDLPKKHHNILREPSSTRPALLLVQENGVKAVVKDFSANGFLFRNIIGRFLVWRESKAYRKLNHLKGIPTLYKVIDGLALVLEAIPGRNLENLEMEMRLSRPFFDALKDLVDSFHKLGMAHCDLKRAPNTLLGDDGNPYITDWGASISEKEFRLFPLNLIYRRFVLDDYMAIIKLKLRHIPEAVTSREMALYTYRSRTEKFVRTVRDKLRYLLQKIA
jgi:serine/threonine protein kinase